MKRLAGLLLILLSVLPLNTKAETLHTPLKMEELAIQIMPEYSYHPEDTKKNHPPLLIGYQGTLVNQSTESQKGKIEIPVPPGLKDIQIGFVADYSSDLSEMYEIEYELDKDRKTISWETSKAIMPGDSYKFVIEFYSSEIERKSDLKSFEYTFKSFTDIGLVNITFLEPLKTVSTKLNPAPETHQENPYGMNMFMYQISGMKLGEEKTYQLTYNRSSSKTTVEMINAIDSNSEEKPIEPKEVDSTEIYMVVGGIAVFSLLSILLLILFLKNKKMSYSNHPVVIGLESKLDSDKALLRTKLIQGEITQKEYNQLIRKKNSYF
jgi:hypothetical protein